MAKDYYTIKEEDGIVRIDKFLAYKFSEYSRAAIAKLFLLNLIKKDGIPIKPGEKIRPGAVIEYDLGPLKDKPEVIALPILYEDDEIIVINKPVGIISHARGKFWQEASVASFIRDKVSNSSGDRAGIVHRLDRATSGVMVCAKNSEILSFLQKQFSERQIEKTYIAVVDKIPPHVEAIIDAPIARNDKDPKSFTVSVEGKSAQTKYRVVKENDHFATLELFPKTGRTHQLRVHLKHINCPIVGDELYGGKVFDRLLLHAWRIKLTMKNGKNKTFEAPLPKEFTSIYE